MKLPDDAAIQMSADTVQPGTFVTLTLTFENADAGRDRRPGRGRGRTIYDDITVGPIETPPAAPAASSSPRRAGPGQTGTGASYL